MAYSSIFDTCQELVDIFSPCDGAWYFMIFHDIKNHGQNPGSGASSRWIFWSKKRMAFQPKEMFSKWRDLLKRIVTRHDNSKSRFTNSLSFQSLMSHHFPASDIFPARIGQDSQGVDLPENGCFSCGTFPMEFPTHFFGVDSERASENPMSGVDHIGGAGAVVQDGRWVAKGPVKISPRWRWSPKKKKGESLNGIEIPWRNCIEIIVDGCDIR